MVFDALRKRFKWLIIIVAAAFAIGLLYVGVPWGGTGTTNAAVIATVNGQNISSDEHLSIFQELAYQYQMYYGPVTAATQELLRYQALEMVLERKLALDAARKEGIKVSKSELDEMMQEQRAMFPSDAEFRSALLQYGLTEAQLRKLIEEELLINKVIERRQSEIEVTDQEIAEAYEAVNARHILIRPESVEGEQDWDGALAKANDLVEQLKGGASFVELAAEHSEDGTAQQGGELGFFGRGMMVPEFEEAAFALQPGEISPEPVRTQYGYHIIEVIERRLPEGEEFESVKEDLRTSLQAQQAQVKVQEWLMGLREAAKIDVKDPQLHASYLVAQGELTEALKYYRKALDESPNDGYINYSMGNVYQYLGDTDQAIENFQLATSKQPYDPELHFVLGQALIVADRVDEGVASLVTAAEWAPNDYMMLVQVNSILSSLGYVEEAETVEELINQFIERYEQQLQLQQQMEQQSQSTDSQDLMSLLDAEAAAAQERLAQEEQAAGDADTTGDE